jgi:SAM-dependent methyltransferase
MTIWNDIYKNHQDGGEAWATIKEGLIPQFVGFIENNEFKFKSGLDIGCGTGKYVRYLQELDFKVDGIDSSEIAIETTKKIGKPESSFICADMFAFEISKDKYDLVYSISTIHHGLKSQVTGLIDKIYEALIPEGKIFITLPNLAASDTWETFKDHEELAPGTYVPIAGPEKGLAHSFFTEDEVKNIFSKFKDVKIELDEIWRWIITATK